MRNLILGIAAIIALGFMSCKEEAKTEQESDVVEVSEDAVETADDVAMTDVSFGVRGNCGMCKETIEEAANGVAGVASANWDVDKKKIDVSFDGSKTDDMAIHNAIAASGYDTEKVDGNEEAYSKLPECCKYDHSMEMNQSGDME